MKNFAILNNLAFLLLLLSSCGGTNQGSALEDKLQKEVFAIHDEVMPKMSEIVQLKGKLIELTPDSTDEATVKATLTQLEKAEDAMMGWMNNFTGPEKMRKTKSHEEIMAYLQNQKAEITKVRDVMNGSIVSAERILSTPKH